MKDRPQFRLDVYNTHLLKSAGQICFSNTANGTFNISWSQKITSVVFFPPYKCVNKNAAHVYATATMTVSSENIRTNKDEILH